MSDPELTPEQEARLRALLADARAQEQMPPEVADRLHGVIAGLARDDSAPERPLQPAASPGAGAHGAQEAPQGDSARVEGAGNEPGATVTELRSRRRKVGALLTAAAAIVVGGMVVSQFVGDDTGPDSNSAGSQADTQQDDQPNSSLQEDSGEPGESGEAGAAPNTMDQAPAPSAPAPTQLAPSRSGEVPGTIVLPQAPKVRASRLAQDIATIVEATRPGPDGVQVVAPGSGVPMAQKEYTCAAGAWATGDLIPVFLGGKPALASVEGDPGSPRVVLVHRCGSGQVLASTTLPAAD